MKQSISRVLDMLANNENAEGERLDESDICRMGQIVCKAIKREDDVDWYSEHGYSAAGPGDVIEALYYYGHHYSGGQWSDTYALGCAAGSIFSPGMGGGLEGGTQASDIYLGWGCPEGAKISHVCTTCACWLSNADDSACDMYDTGTAEEWRECIHAGELRSEYDFQMTTPYGWGECECCGDGVEDLEVWLAFVSPKEVVQ